MSAEKKQRGCARPPHVSERLRFEENKHLLKSAMLARQWRGLTEDKPCLADQISMPSVSERKLRR